MDFIGSIERLTRVSVIIKKRVFLIVFTSEHDALGLRS